MFISGFETLVRNDFEQTILTVGAAPLRGRVSDGRRLALRRPDRPSGGLLNRELQSKLFRVEDDLQLSRVVADNFGTFGERLFVEASFVPKCSVVGSFQLYRRLALQEILK